MRLSVCPSVRRLFVRSSSIDRCLACMRCGRCTQRLSPSERSLHLRLIHGFAELNIAARWISRHPCDNFNRVILQTVLFQSINKSINQSINHILTWPKQQLSSCKNCSEYTWGMLDYAHVNTTADYVIMTSYLTRYVGASLQQPRCEHARTPRYHFYEYRCVDAVVLCVLWNLRQ